jgi:hypothetical protein
MQGAMHVKIAHARTMRIASETGRVKSSVRSASVSRGQ